MSHFKPRPTIVSISLTLIVAAVFWIGVAQVTKTTYEKAFTFWNGSYTVVPLPENRLADAIYMQAQGKEEKQTMDGFAEILTEFGFQANHEGLRQLLSFEVAPIPEHYFFDITNPGKYKKPAVIAFMQASISKRANRRQTLHMDEELGLIIHLDERTLTVYTAEENTFFVNTYTLPSEEPTPDNVAKL